MRVRIPIISLAMILAVGACGEPQPVANEANAAARGAPVANKPVSSPAGGPPRDQAPAPAAAPAPAEAPPAAAPAVRIPAALQGRWGLSPADCTSALGDAKGLLVINGSELRFYESRAVPSPGAEVRADSIRGNFRFTGEGQTWTRFERLELSGRNLVRIDSNPTASYTYAKC
jgi:hypothetical protein